MARKADRRYLSPDEDGSFLDAPTPRYQAGSQDDALRAQGVDPDASAAVQLEQIDAARKVQGLGPIPAYEPHAQD